MRGDVGIDRPMTMLRRLFPAWLFCAWCTLAAAGAPPWFVIRVVDAATGRGVPLVELETVNHLVHVTDSAGVIAFHEPGLMEREVFFFVRSHGYEFPPDGLGNRGLKLTPRAGATATVRVTRRNVAERLYRLTGAGIYRDSVLAGLPVPLRAPVLNAEVLGQDTVVVTPYRGKLHWFWGDTDRASYALGNFAAAGATSELPGRGGLAPDVGVDFTYFTDATGFARRMCPDFGEGLHWIESVFTVPDADGVERLVARVSSQKGLVLPHAWHLAIWNDARQVFESKVRWVRPDGHDAAHPFRARSGGTDYLYLYPNFRVPADLASLGDPARYEAFTCVADDGRLPEGGAPVIDRDADGAPRYAWKRGADRLHEDRVKRLLAGGYLQPAEAWRPLHDFATGASITPGRGSVCWNAHRRRWVMLVSAQAGEIWFAEADTPTGPWAYAWRVVAHDQYNFYNPTQHPFFDGDGGRVVYFEGTYTASFSAAKSRTPRYDYNQIMYRLRLDDPRLDLPVAVHRVAGGGRTRLLLRDEIARTAAWDRIEAVPFFALPPECGRDGLVPVFQEAEGRLALAAAPGATPLFRALPLDPATPEGHRTAATVPLHAFERAADGAVFYAVADAPPPPGFTRHPQPLCQVWRSPTSRVLFDRTPLEVAP